jgi:hypothetical protein
LFTSLTILFLLAVALAPAVAVTRAQEGPQVNFSPYVGNPIIPLGAEGTWESGIAALARVIYHEGSFHMFYIGSEQYDIQPSHVGYAASEDGLTWTKFDGNPVLSLDPGVAPYGVGMIVPFIEDDTWILYLSPRLQPGIGLGETIIRATAPGPTGPWTVDDTILLQPGGGRDWDNAAVSPIAVFRVEDGYRLYFLGFGSDGNGLALSPNGLAWIKYDDPNTDQAMYRHSDPVLVAGERGRWDDGFTFGSCVLFGDNGWEMFYSGGSVGQPTSAAELGLGYATSADGITWTRHGDTPFLVFDEGLYANWPSVVVVEGVYYLYYNLWEFNENPAAHVPLGIGVATGSITQQ